MLILASNSPRRRELLQQIGVQDFTVRPAKGEESAPDGLEPAQLVEYLARQKGEEVQKSADPDDIVIAADTVVAIDGQVMGKPENEAQAKEMLRTLSGHQHQVYTGVAVLKGRELRLSHECTHVFFREMTPEEIDWYVADGEPMDKAGGYGIQGKGARFVRRIEGDYCNVVGLPVCKLVTMLEDLP